MYDILKCILIRLLTRFCNCANAIIPLFSDVAIGAPQEDDLRGAIYIYNGRRSGIARSFSQVRSPSAVYTDITGGE